MTISDKFLKDVLEPGERKVAHSSLHWIYLVNGYAWFILLAGIGWGADWALWSYLGAYIPHYEFRTSIFQFGLRPGWIGWLFTACAATILITQYIRYLTTDILVTTKRITIKNGWINIKLDSTDMSDVRAFHVDQGWLGQFFKYGKINLDCRFVKDVQIPYARSPYELVRDMQEVKSKVEAPPHVHAAPAPQLAQTIIQIHPGGHGPQGSITSQPGETIIIQTGPNVPTVQHHGEDILLHDFNKKQ